MQPKAKMIDTYIRTPTWIVANFLANFTPDGTNFKYTEEQKRDFKANPEKLRDHRREMEHVFNCYFAMLMKDSPQQHGVRGMVEEAMKQQLGIDSELSGKLIPDFPVGCRRITPGDGYLEAIKADNCRVRFEKIVELTEKGIVSQPAADTGPEVTEYDIIVCATGFDVSFVPAWEMKGANGADLKALWKEEAEGYLGICAPEMPNYFIFNGPNCPIGHGSLMACMDAASDYMLQWFSKIASQGIK
jgi:cation diffusion facilitator CzcD-associated flavoprotein CzcO